MKVSKVIDRRAVVGLLGLGMMVAAVTHYSVALAVLFAGAVLFLYALTTSTSE